MTSSTPQAIAELRGKKFPNFERLYHYSRKNRGLQKAISALAEMNWRDRSRSEKARRLVEQLDARRDRHYGSNFKSRLKK